MPEREDRVADVAGEIEMLLQKWERKQLAEIVLRSTDAQSLDHPAADRAYRAKRTDLTAAVYKLADTIVDGVNMGTAMKESVTESNALATTGGQLPDLKKPSVALRFAEMWAAGKLDKLTEGQQSIFLSALGEHIGVKAELGDIMLYQGKPYITISGYRRIAHNTGLLNGITVEPAADRDRLRFGAKTGEHLWIARIFKKGCARPFEGWGYVRTNDKNPVTKTHPQEMAKKRAIYDGLRLAFPPAEVIGELHTRYIDMAEESVSALTGAHLTEGGYGEEVPDIETGTGETVAAETVPTPQELEDREFQDDRHLVD